MAKDLVSSTHSQCFTQLPDLGHQGNKSAANLLNAAIFLISFLFLFLFSFRVNFDCSVCHGLVIAVACLHSADTHLLLKSFSSLGYSILMARLAIIA